MRCWHGYLYMHRCRSLVGGPADATAITKLNHFLLFKIQNGSTSVLPSYPGCPRKVTVKRVFVFAVFRIVANLLLCSSRVICCV